MVRTQPAALNFSFRRCCWVRGFSILADSLQVAVNSSHAGATVPACISILHALPVGVHSTVMPCRDRLR